MGTVQTKIFLKCSATAEQRTKEIGIRKVLVASVSSLFVLLSKQFLFFVALALLIACPLAWFAMSKWLDDYAYRIEISWWMFVVAGLVALFIALFTVRFPGDKSSVGKSC
jgi:putative ABC transport system permease protein